MQALHRTRSSSRSTELSPPALTIQQLGDDSQAGKLLRQAGLL